VGQQIKFEQTPSKEPEKELSQEEEEDEQSEGKDIVMDAGGMFDADMSGSN
jgi:hypothetical protein